MIFCLRKFCLSKHFCFMRSYLILYADIVISFQMHWKDYHNFATPLTVVNDLYTVESLNYSHPLRRQSGISSQLVQFRKRYSTDVWPHGPFGCPISDLNSGVGNFRGCLNVRSPVPGHTHTTWKKNKKKTGELPTCDYITAESYSKDWKPDENVVQLNLSRRNSFVEVLCIRAEFQV